MTDIAELHRELVARVLGNDGTAPLDLVGQRSPMRTWMNRCAR